MNDKILLKSSKNGDNRDESKSSSVNGVVGSDNGYTLKKPERKDNFKKKEIKP